MIERDEAVLLVFKRLLDEEAGEGALTRGFLLFLLLLMVTPAMEVWDSSRGRGLRCGVGNKVPTLFSLVRRGPCVSRGSWRELFRERKESGQRWGFWGREQNSCVYGCNAPLSWDKLHATNRGQRSACVRHMRECVPGGVRLIECACVGTR